MSPIRCLVTLLALSLALPHAAPAGDWPTAGHDTRRTGQSEARGPATAVAPDELVIGESNVNMPATIDEDGTLFTGTWGLAHDHGAPMDPLQWTRHDGRMYAFAADLTPAWADPFAGDPVPYCYVEAGRPDDCPHLVATRAAYAGTFEGTSTLSADRTTLYVGRGDGKLYALDAATGQLRWKFPTYDPTDRDGPDGGGEIIAGPLVGPDGTIYAVTAGLGAYETNAVYAIDADGHEEWRFPSSDRTWQGAFQAAPALSPDGSRLYVASAWGPTYNEPDPAVPGTLLAFDLGVSPGSGEDHLLWSLPLTLGVSSYWPTHLAVGTDGTIFTVGGVPVPLLLTSYAIAVAYRDLGTSAQMLWQSLPLEGQLGKGIALREVAGVTTRVYVTTGSVYYNLSESYAPAGVLVAFDPANGTKQWPTDFRPQDYGADGAMTGIALGSDGTVYTGVSGITEQGRVFAVRKDGTLAWEWTLHHLLEWGHPVLGPHGDLYVSDSGEIRRCVNDDDPVELGLCPQADDPRLYHFRPALFVDGFESGDLSGWSRTYPPEPASFEWAAAMQR